MMIRLLVTGRENPSVEWLQNLTNQPGFELVAVVGTVTETLQRIETCDIALVSVDLPDDGAYDIVRAVTRYDHCAQVVILGAEAQRPAALRYLEAGAMGFISLTQPIDTVGDQLRAVMRGGAVLPPEVTGAVLERLCELAAWFEEVGLQNNKMSMLTRREREVLHLIGRDFTNQDIANHLIIEVGTVKNHVHNILAKLKVSSRREAASFVPLTRDRGRRSHYSTSRSERYLV